MYVEVFFGALVFVFGLIGLVRGFLKELGVTTVMMFVLFCLGLFEPRLISGVDKFADLAGKVIGMGDKNQLQCWFFMLVVVGGAFVSYQGETLTFAGKAPVGAYGAALSWVTGILNGYLVAGSIWYYLDKFGYPIHWMGLTQEGLSGLAKNLIGFLPANFLGQDVLFGQSLLLYLAVALLLARVIR